MQHDIMMYSLIIAHMYMFENSDNFQLHWILEM